MESLILFLLEFAFNGFNDRIQNIVDIVTQTPEGFNSVIASSMRNVFNVMLPIGYTFLVLFFLIEFTNKAILFETKNLELFVSQILKLIIAVIIMENLFELLEVIFGIASYIADLIGATTINDMNVNLDSAKEVVGDMGILDTIVFFATILPMMLIVFCVQLIILLIAYGRMIEIYIMMALAPIPISTLSSSSHQNVGKNYLQHFAGVCLQGAVILICISIYGNLASSILIELGDSQGSILTAISQQIFITITLALVLWKSGAWSKKLVGAI